MTHAQESSTRNLHKLVSNFWYKKLVQVLSDASFWYQTDSWTCKSLTV